ncbi:response regulator transcription factor [Crateriforma conspicua]|uniref:Uncharacterized protein n=1 Tax=Crateriforma conspicua TaxID=2527996 RepID=A0A5C5XZZ0_9PLAN|nr:hypothetical protein [Crateriforma conspicua]QDV63530.1 hypothetical protein Mal65_26740 [Crateriforma conspicua]TWT68967.1 hypothetical protein Pan14r_12510 [Crateriforma conspicua]
MHDSQSGDPPQVWEYQTPMEEEKAEVVSFILRWNARGRTEPLDLDRFESSIVLKNTQRMITCENEAFRRLTAAGQSSVGLATDSYMATNFAKLSRDSDSMLLDGVNNLELEHLWSVADGRTATMTTYKRRMHEIKDPRYAILVIGRVSSVMDRAESDYRRTLTEVRELLVQLDEVDRSICRGYARGDTTKEIASSVGRTTRAVELRRQKIMDLMGFDRPIEIVKMLVRLEENGLISEHF